MTTKENKRQGRPKSEEKRQLILHAASCLFLQDGFGNTSMDNVAKASGVSKQTVYSHFDNKDSLFQAVIHCKCQAYQLDTTQLRPITKPLLPLDQYLSQLGTKLIRLLQDPDAIAIFRIIIGEAGNNPHMATLFYDAGPVTSLNSLGEVFYQYGAGKLSRELSLELAQDFYALLKGEFHTLLLCDLQSPMTDEEIEAHVIAAVHKTSVLFSSYCQ